MKVYYQKVKKWYFRYERSLSSVSLVAGFFFDSITLKRVDLFLENFWVLAHLFIAALAIILLNLNERLAGEIELEMRGTFSKSVRFWSIIVIQFAFGGLLSTFLVFYFRSATLATSWPFLLLLALLFAANEILKKHYIRLTFQVSFLFISIFSFAIFILPVVFHHIGVGMFVISGFVSLAGITFFVFLLRFLSKEQFKRSRMPIFLSVLGLYSLMNILYFTNIIPPLPLSLKDSGVFHSIVRNGEGNYEVSVEKNDFNFLYFITSKEVVHTHSNGPVYVYSAIFSPAHLNTTIIHEWEHYDENQKKWISVSRITLSIVGGRAEGYRTYSALSNVSLGLWRVDVQTISGGHIGRISFEVKKATNKLELNYKILK